MTLLTSAGSGSSILSPEDVQALVIEPLIRDAIATRVSTVVQTSSHDARFPIVKTDPTCGWTPEGTEIDTSDADLDELVATPLKLAGLTVCSNELVADSDPSALDIVGQGLVRDLQVRLDAAYFGSTTADGPNGIAHLTGAQHVDGGSALTDLDPFAEALSLAETVGSVITGFVASPANVLAVSTLKVAATYNQPLLGVDPSSPTKRSVFGVPLYSSPAVDDDVVWAIPSAKTFVVMRLPASVVTDSSAFFSSDRTAVRCTTRISFAFPHEAAVVRIDLGGS
jgi:HK97 family phage major capsid protein